MMDNSNAECMRDREKRILIIITTQFVPYGGLTTVMMNYYRAMNRDGLRIDFASTNEPPESLIEEINSNGSRYYCLGNRKRVFGYACALFRLLKANRYDVIHVNGNSATMMLELLPAKLLRVPIRIAHVHTSKPQHTYADRFVRPVFKRTYNKAIAVSEQAGNALFKKDYMVLKNAIDTGKYAFSATKRESTRDRLSVLPDAFLVGTVGKLNHGKNHEYLLEVFSEVKKELKGAMLLIVGGGPLEQELKARAQALSIGDSVVFTGMVDDASDYYQALDLFCFPSRYEGFGLVLIEAQAAGLKCAASEYVPRETDVTSNVKYLSIEGNVDEWADLIISSSKAPYDRAEMSENAILKIRECGLDIREEARSLERVYTS